MLNVEEPANHAGPPAASGSASTETLRSSTEMLRIHGARVHNLQNIDVEIPRGQMVVITGPSGSGKSSLAFDTIFAEGQRQYIESLSIYARQFLHQLERPDVDLIEGLQPTVAIDQRAGSHNPRSTVATVTEIYDHLRLLMARVGTAFCYQCGAPIRQQSLEQILDDLLALPPNTKIMLLGPMVRGRKGEHKEVFDEIRKAGFVRARVDGAVHDLDAVPELSRQKVHHIEAVIDRLLIREGIRSRLAESVQLALTHGNGLVIASYLEQTANAWSDRLYSRDYACPNCGISYEELEPRTFSFNSPYGACPECDGLGTQTQFDPELVLPELSLSLEKGAVAPWRGNNSKTQSGHREQVAEFLQAAGASAATPLADLKPAVLDKMFYGDGKQFLGLRTFLDQELVTATKENAREKLEAFRGAVPCAGCGGARLRREARWVRVGGKAIHEITALTVDAASEFFAALRFDARETPVGTPIVREITSRLDFLAKVGLSYLTLDRPADTLSGGELQRIRLATGLGSGLVGACYVLDEPSIGLHPRDNDRLIDALRDLQRQGNSVLVVEHDEAMMRAADQIIDLGPGAGRNGGRIIAQGTPDEVSRHPASLTGKYLSGELSISQPQARNAVQSKRAITIAGVTTNNLKNVTVQFPLSMLICVTGVSGSGKSSLVNGTLARAIARKLTGGGPKPGPYASLKGVDQIDKLVIVDQSPIGRSPRSNPATYTGLFDEIRKVFAHTRDAKLRGFKANRFSFNVAGGRCEDCQGQGQQKLEMSFLPDLYVTCPTCQGARFNQQTLEVKYRGLSIADVLNLRVDEAVEFFANFAVILRLLTSLSEVGLEYLTLGQSSTTLSGGEAQRIKLATELGRTDTGKTLYLLDEPTTGLHFDDIRKLLHVLNRLVKLGNTVLVIEHNIDVMKSADWIIDLGPEGGAAGGHLLFEGPPEALAALPGNVTGQWLVARG